jgi:transcriptional regulator with XRE-family HTH domain
MNQGISLSEFAQRAGVTHTTVSKAVRAGRLVLCPEGGLDPKLLRTKWRARAKPKHTAPLPEKSAAPEPELNADGSPKKKRGRPLKKPTDAPPTTASEYAAVTLQKERSLAGLRQLEYEQRAGVLITIETSRRVLFEQARGARDHWLNWPARVAPLLAADLGVEPVDALRVLTKLVHAHVSAMGEPDGSDIRSRED